MSNYKQTKQYIDGVTKQKNNTEARCANQRQQLALLNAQVKEYKDLLKECRDYIQIMADGANSQRLEWHEDTAYNDGKKLLTKIDNAIGEKK